MEEESAQIKSNLEQLRNHAWKDPTVVVATGFGIGWFPFAPGTLASLAIALIFWFLIPVSPLAQYVTIFALFIGARVTLGLLVRKYGSYDAPCVVLDEFLGMAIAIFLVPKVWWLYIIAFVIFRIFDIVKPWPISWIDSKIKGAYGMILDDVVAGIGALVITHLIWLTQA